VIICNVAQVSPPILVADATPALFNFTRRAAVNVQVRFYTDAAGTVPSDTGLGSRDLTATNSSMFYERGRDSGYRAKTLESEIDNGALMACVGGTWYEMLLGGGMQQLTLAATGGADPPGAASYRIAVDAEGDV
jgi:hypothetical protein